MSVLTTSYEKDMHYKILRILGGESDYIYHIDHIPTQCPKWPVHVTFTQCQLELYTGET